MAKARSDAGRSVLEDATAARLRAELVRYLARRAGNPALAEDLAQEAMLHIVEGLPDFRGSAELRTWARRVALNVWRDHLRRRAASPAERAASGEVFSVTAPSSTRSVRQRPRFRRRTRTTVASRTTVCSPPRAGCR